MSGIWYYLFTDFKHGLYVYQVWINVKFMSVLMSLPCLLLNVKYEFTCFLCQVWVYTMGFLSQVWYYLIPLSCDAAPAPSLLVQEDFNEGLYVLVTQLGTSHGLYQLRGISQGIFKTSRLIYTHAPVGWYIHMHQTFYCFNRSNRYSFSTKIYWIIDQYWSKFLKI